MNSTTHCLALWENKFKLNAGIKVKLSNKRGLVLFILGVFNMAPNC
jgi:hypothetical protein